MRDNETASWTNGLRFIQWSLNTTYHEAIKMHPYQAMFGVKPKMGLGTNVPAELLERISSGINEEDLMELISNNDNGADENESPNDNGADENESPNDNDVDENESPNDNDANENESLNDNGADENESPNDNPVHPVIEARQNTCKNLEKQAKKMVL